MSNTVGKDTDKIAHTEEDIARERSLAVALAEVRNRQANRDDVVIDMKEAELARLEMLANEIKPLFAELPSDNDQFEFALTNGQPPRLWIDMTAHVSMGRDRRIYRFLKDTKAGRTLLAETGDLNAVADVISNYVAERVLERERILEGEWTHIRLAKEPEPKVAPVKRRSGWLNFLWLLIGIGLSGLAAYAWTHYGSLLQL